MILAGACHLNGLEAVFTQQFPDGTSYRSFVVNDSDTRLHCLHRPLYTHNKSILRVRCEELVSFVTCHEVPM
jgi:hypothetical protein